MTQTCPQRLSPKPTSNYFLRAGGGGITHGKNYAGNNFAPGIVSPRYPRGVGTRPDVTLGTWHMQTPRQSSRHALRGIGWRQEAGGGSPTSFTWRDPVPGWVACTQCRNPSWAATGNEVTAHSYLAVAGRLAGAVCNGLPVEPRLRHTGTPRQIVPVAESPPGACW